MSFFVSQRASLLGLSPIRRLFEAAPADAVHLGLGQPTEPTPEEIVDLCREALSHDWLGYTPNAGLPELRECIASHISPRVTGQRVCVTSGSQEAMFLAMQALLDPGDEVLIPDPGFVAYPAVAQLCGAVPVTYPLGHQDMRPQIEAIASKIGPRTRMLVVNTPGNPTGTVIDHQTMAQLGQLCDQRGVYLLSDEVYREIYFGPEAPPTAETYCERAVVIGALSKSHAMTGWRLGWIVSPLEVAERVKLVHAYVMTCTAALVQHTALRLLSTELGKTLAAQARARYRQRRELLLDQLAQRDLKAIRPEGSFYALLKIREFGKSSETVAWGALEQEKVVTVPGSVFGPGGEGFLRLSFAGDEATIAEGIARLARYLKGC